MFRVHERRMLNDVERLLADIRACRLCEQHLPLGARPVFQWSPQARILVVGQAPGTKVHATGIPFNDPSGDRLRAWMGIGSDVFYDARQIALLPMGFCYPGRGKGGDLPPRTECAATWRSRLLEAMNGVELTLTLGDYAQRYHQPHLAQLALTERVRRWREDFPRLVPMPHPSPRNNLWLRRNPWFEEEVVPAVRQRVAQVLK
jgi:uracil-DNA glycosylase